jgi:hypothetical protein
MHEELCCPDLVCELIPHPTMPRHHAISVILLSFWLSFKISQREVVHEDFNLMSSQIMLPCLKATHNTQFFFVNRLLELCSIILFAFKRTSVPFLHENPFDSEVFASMWTSNNLVKSWYFNIRVDEFFSFKSLNAYCCSFFHLKNNSFFRRFESGSPFTKILL